MLYPGGGGGGGVMHEILAAQPAAVILPSDVNLIVMQVPVETTIPGELPPVYVPINGDAVFGPL